MITTGQPRSQEGILNVIFSNTRVVTCADENNARNVLIPQRMRDILLENYLIVFARFAIV